MRITDLGPQQALRLDAAVDRGWLQSTLLDMARQLEEDGYTDWLEAAGLHLPTGLAFLRFVSEGQMSTERKGGWVRFNRITP